MIATLLGSAASYCQLNNVLATWIIHSYYFYADNNFLYKAIFVMITYKKWTYRQTSKMIRVATLAIYLHVSE